MSLSDLSGAPSLFGKGSAGRSNSAPQSGGLVPLGGKPRHVGGTSDFDALLDIIEEEDNPKKKSSKNSTSIKNKSKSGISSSKDKDKDVKAKKSSSRNSSTSKNSSTSSKVSKSSTSSKGGSRSSDDELMLSSDDLNDVDIPAPAHARPRTAGLDRAHNSDPQDAARGAGGAKLSESKAPAKGKYGFDTLSPTKEGSECEQSPGQSQVMSIFRDDKNKRASPDDVDSLSSDLSDILGVCVCVCV